MIWHYFGCTSSISHPLLGLPEVIQEWLGDPKELAVTVLETRVKNAESARLAAEEALEAAKEMEIDVQAALADLEAQRAAAILKAESELEVPIEIEESPAPESEDSSGE